MKRFFLIIKGSLSTLLIHSVAFASDPLGGAEEIDLGDGDITTIQGVRSRAEEAIGVAVSFLGLIAFITIVIAGIWMVVGLGSDDSRERAKKIILYTVTGLFLVILAAAIVTLIADIA